MYINAAISKIMSKTERILLVRVADDEVEETLSDAIQNANVERGVSL